MACILRAPPAAPHSRSLPEPPRSGRRRTRRPRSTRGRRPPPGLAPPAALAPRPPAPRTGSGSASRDGYARTAAMATPPAPPTAAPAGPAPAAPRPRAAAVSPERGGAWGHLGAELGVGAVGRPCSLCRATGGDWGLRGRSGDFVPRGRWPLSWGMHGGGAGWRPVRGWHHLGAGPALWPVFLSGASQAAAGSVGTRMEGRGPAREECRAGGPPSTRSPSLPAPAGRGRGCRSPRGEGGRGGCRGAQEGQAGLGGPGRGRGGVETREKTRLSGWGLACPLLELGSHGWGTNN